MDKNAITLCGLLGSAIAAAYGGWTDGMTTLAIFVGVDLLTGFMCATVFKKSAKTETGAYASNEMQRGLTRKGMIFLVILIAHRMDMIMGSETYVRDAACIAFIINEAASIIENAGLMGVPIPKAVTRMIDVLKKKEDEEDGTCS